MKQIEWQQKKDFKSELNAFNTMACVCVHECISMNCKNCLRNERVVCTFGKIQIEATEKLQQRKKKHQSRESEQAIWLILE